MRDILVNLGPDWGHIVPLTALENIIHIECSSSYITVECKTSTNKHEQNLKFTSAISFRTGALDRELDRLMGFSNGIIGKADTKVLIKAMENQSGKKYPEVLSDPSYDIAAIRAIWADFNDVPFFRFSLQYDTESDQIIIDKTSNVTFSNIIIPNWLDARTIELVTDPDELMFVFAYESLYRLVEPILPDPNGEAMMDPAANIPPMAGVVGANTQRVDLASIDKSNILASS